MNNTCIFNYKGSCLQHKKKLSRQSLSRHLLSRKNLIKKIKVHLPEPTKNNTCIAYRKNKIFDETTKPINLKQNNGSPTIQFYLNFLNCRYTEKNKAWPRVETQTFGNKGNGVKSTSSRQEPECCKDSRKSKLNKKIKRVRKVVYWKKSCSR